MADDDQDVVEKRANRPYRRFVGVIFALTITILSILILRGIIRSIDRMPTADALSRPGHVDTRALRACAEDLEKLEAKIRLAGSTALGKAEDTDPPWPATEQALEVERLHIVARCHLESGEDDPAVQDLATASSAIERLIRNYGLLHARHLSEGMSISAEAKEALLRANTALKSR